MEIVRLPVVDVHFDPANLRKHPDAQVARIKASLARFGQQRPILIDAKRVVIAGNGTLRGILELGWPEVDCVVSGLEGAAAVQYAIADNRLAELAEWDQEALITTVRAAQSEPGFDLAAIGFSGEEVDALAEGLGSAALAAAGAGAPRDPGNFASQYAVIVVCDGEASQRQAYEDLVGLGFNCKVVVT